MSGEAETREKGTVLVLGVTSAVARALAGLYAEEGYDILAAGRDPEEVEAIARDLEVRHGVRARPLDFHAERFETHGELRDRVIELSGGALEGVVLAFGYMAEQADAERDFEEARRTIDVSYTAAVSMLERLGGYMEGRGRGFVCVLSSVAGDRGRPSNYIYGSAKAALTTYAAGLRARLFKSGVSVTTVKPGFMDTKMTFGRPGMFLVASPEGAARAIHRAVARRADEAYVPGFWWGIMALIRSIPEFLFKRLKL